MNNITAGFALCGSFCTFEKATEQIINLVDKGWNVSFDVVQEKGASFQS